MRAWTSGLVALLASCAANQPLHFSSAPPGAAIFVNGADSGFVTPALVDLPDPEDSRIEFVLDGYQTAVRQLKDERQGELVLWSEASTSAKSWNFPLFLPYKDFFFFYKRANSSRLEQQVRGRIFVRLRRSSDQ
ncbi:MAG: hypothetical protein QF404_14420 [Planctomycetota bacterium]|nr:hypothetical protein [Planctomycetota bacterium]MDP6938305.1 hypothetical protein [Planctomycetota bacterium]